MIYLFDNDISIFFEQNLGIIRGKCALTNDWPCAQTITCLVQSAGGLFDGPQLPAASLVAADNLLKVVSLVSSRVNPLLKDQRTSSTRFTL
jgi:hypothetical protein